MQEQGEEKTFEEQLQCSRENARVHLQYAKNFYCVSFDENGKATLNIAMKAKPEDCVGMLIAILQDLETRLGNLCESLSAQENTNKD